ncbi:hypothetical protein M1V81_07620 [Klebsiella pneumoniae]|uniref:Uncharacterized protein n=1 Tax=Raoultella ornithinolytica TaxID=54291 RepID=A0A9Q9MZJ7_RAOOR|nr:MULTISPECIES: hypothetical protein [Klebsiella/Raoultella group]EKC7835492.1 hypothetical protein [Klebsiella pneumoniae]EKC8268152.1 hypothetical protein [Klebsiella pneumoniae]EKW5899357.1 hypothetical protein [Klebsiella pneumoniae]MCP5857503.1 hypothetical protein [Klebsiella pneumoniae]MDY9940399.1 hypothetical protein [Klebsiella pneumoniae]
MQPHQQRVVDEAVDLTQKTVKLGMFVDGSPIFLSLDIAQQGLLKAQLGAMRAYLEILNLRINSF